MKRLLTPIQSIRHKHVGNLYGLHPLPKVGLWPTFTSDSATAELRCDIEGQVWLNAGTDVEFTPNPEKWAGSETGSVAEGGCRERGCEH